MKEPLLVAFAGLFFIVLIVRVINSYILAHRLKSKDQFDNTPQDADDRLIAILKDVSNLQKAKESFREITHMALGVKTPAGRAAYYSAAAGLALNHFKRPNLAVGLYLKALRVNPSCLEAIRQLQRILTIQKRPKRLEWTYWEVLARLDDSEIGDETWLTCWAGLAALYAGSPKTTHRADAIRKSLSMFMADDEGEQEMERISHIPDSPI